MRIENQSSIGSPLGGLQSFKEGPGTDDLRSFKDINLKEVFIAADEVVCVAFPRASKEFVVLRIPCDVDGECPLRHVALGVQKSNERIDLLVCPSVVSSYFWALKHFPDFRQDLESCYKNELSRLKEASEDLTRWPFFFDNTAHDDVGVEDNPHELPEVLF
jgi:hypothetical protein